MAAFLIGAALAAVAGLIAVASAPRPIPIPVRVALRGRRR